MTDADKNVQIYNYLPSDIESRGGHMLLCMLQPVHTRIHTHALLRMHTQIHAHIAQGESSFKMMSTSTNTYSRDVPMRNKCCNHHKHTHGKETTVHVDNIINLL